jgi:CO/xanthine dehydrogenase FAD-binding subunit
MPSIRTINKFEYLAPLSLNEALVMLREAKDAKILAGGTDLLVQMKYGLCQPSLIIDVKNIPEPNAISAGKNGVYVGSAIPLSKMLASPLFPREFNMLTQACSLIGSVQVRNRATMAGNICNAAPSADSAPALLCLGAKVIAVCSRGSRTINVADFFKAPGETALNADELVIAIEIPLPSERSAGCYLRHTTREEMDIAVVGVGSFLTLTQDRKIKQARIALGAVAPTPLRAYEAEYMLTGKAPTQEIIDQVAAKTAEEAVPISDMRGSANYRCEMVKVLTRRTLERSLRELGVEIKERA